MSGYRIVLNLTGNAGRKIDRLADDLARANANAVLLAGNLGLVAAASHNVAPIRSTGGGARNYAPRSAGDPHYTRHKYTRIGSYGTGVNFGGFSARLSTIIQPDANGNIFGMNAANLMRGANIASLATALVGTVARTAAKVIAGATIAPIAIGGGVLMGAIHALQSESYAGGVRLIARRHQAKLGLGADYERAQTSADFLSSAYGLDRSTTLSSINVLSGMGVGGTARRLTTGEASGLTKVGGLISQQSGVSFERVMTNIQQLLSQAAPNIRDIREMINQAPILNKYAMKDMEAMGVKGVDVRTWLKDQGHIMSVLKRYELDMASNQGMQSRGEIALAMQDFWVKIASNDSFWKLIGSSGKSVIGSAGTGVSALMTSLASNDAFRIMLAHIGTIFDNLSVHGGTFIEKLNNLIDALARKYGLDIGDRGAAGDKVGRDRLIENMIQNRSFSGPALEYARSKGIFKDLITPEARAQKKSEILRLAEEYLKTDTAFNVSATNPSYQQTSFADRMRERFSNGFIEGVSKDTLRRVFSDRQIGMMNRGSAYEAANLTANDSTFRFFTPTLRKAMNGDVTNPMFPHYAYSANTNDAMKSFKTMIDEMTAANMNIPTDINKGEGVDLTGANADRRALEIHFHAPIVEWTNTMETMSPQETVGAVADNIEQLTAMAIQKALLGASEKMSTRWYK